MAKKLSPTNRERAARAEKLAKTYNSRVSDDLQSNIVDLLTDTMHLAHSKGLHFRIMATLAAHNFRAELKGEE